MRGGGGVGSGTGYGDADGDVSSWLERGWAAGPNGGCEDDDDDIDVRDLADCPTYDEEIRGRVCPRTHPLSSSSSSSSSSSWLLDVGGQIRSALRSAGKGSSNHGGSSYPSIPTPDDVDGDDWLRVNYGGAAFDDLTEGATNARRVSRGGGGFGGGDGDASGDEPPRRSSSRGGVDGGAFSGGGGGVGDRKQREQRDSSLDTMLDGVKSFVLDGTGDLDGVHTSTTTGGPDGDVAVTDDDEEDEEGEESVSSTEDEGEVVADEVVGVRDEDEDDDDDSSPVGIDADVFESVLREAMGGRPPPSAPTEAPTDGGVDDEELFSDEDYFPAGDSSSDDDDGEENNKARGGNDVGLDWKGVVMGQTKVDLAGEGAMLNDERAASAPTMGTMKDIMRAMDDELRDTNVGRHRHGRSSTTDYGQQDFGDGSGGVHVDDDDDDPVNIDVAVLSDLLESLDMEERDVPGPVSNMLREMGIELPRHDGECFP